jgi:hypothetical protein
MAKMNDEPNEKLDGGMFAAAKKYPSMRGDRINAHV